MTALPPPDLVQLCDCRDTSLWMIRASCPVHGCSCTPSDAFRRHAFDPACIMHRDHPAARWMEDIAGIKLHPWQRRYLNDLATTVPQEKP